MKKKGVVRLARKLPKILIIDDEDRYVLTLARLFEGEIEVMGAATLEEADIALHDRSDWDIIFVDGCVPGQRLNTIPLVEKIVQSGFSGQLIAFSGHPYFRRLQMKAGCTGECSKYDLINFLTNFLKGSDKGGVEVN